MNMGMKLFCKDIDPKGTCSYVVKGETMEEFQTNLTNHAKTVHGYTNEQINDPKMVEAVMAAVKMPHFVVLGTFTQKRIETIKELPGNLKEATEIFKSYGARIGGLMFTLGRYDVVGLFDAPNAEAITKALLKWGSRGLLRTETLTGFTGEEMKELLKDM